MAQHSGPSLSYMRSLLTSSWAYKNVKFSSVSYMMRCAIWYHSHNLKKRENNHGGVLLLIKPKALLKVTASNS